MAWFNSYTKRSRGFFFDNVFKSFSLGGTTVASEQTNDDDTKEVLTTNNLHESVMANITSVGTLGNVTVTNKITGGNIEISGNDIKNSQAGQNLVLSADGGNVVINDNITVNTNAVITGNLTVNGTTTTVNSTNTTIADPLYILNNGQSGTPTKDGGFVIERGSSNNVAWIWDESADKFIAVETSEDGTTAGDVSIIGYADMQVKDITANAFSGDGSALTGIAEAQVTQHQHKLSITESQISDLGSYITGYTVTSSDVTQHQSDITSVGTLDSLTVTGNITGNYLLGDGSQLTGLPETYTNSNVATYLETATGDTQTGNLTVSASSTVEFNENILGNIGTPVASTDAATKGYVDTSLSSVATNAYDTIAVSGEASLTASGSSTLTFAAGTGTSISTDASTDTITIQVETSIFGGVNDEDLGSTADSVTQSEDLGDLTTASNSENLGSVVALEGVAAPTQLILPDYETGSEPSASPGGQLIYQSGALKYSDGSSWNSFSTPDFTAIDTNIVTSQNITGVNITSSGTLTANVATISSVSGNLTIDGTLSATAKSFLIPHPTKEGKQLRYASLEGPENGVYVRGKLTNENIIELPDYWSALVDTTTITVNLTPVGQHQNLFVEEILEDKVIVGGDNVNCFYTVYAERKDIDKLKVEE